MGDITDADYMNAKGVCKGLVKVCIWKVIHYFRLMFSNTSKNYVSKFFHLDFAKILSASGLAWQAASKKTEVTLELITDIDMLFIVEKGIGGRIFHAIHWYAKAKNKYHHERSW